MSASAPPGTRYSSARMQKRRADVLVATRKLISQQGLDGFTVKMIANEAATTTTTIFNIWGDKAAIIRQAISEVFHLDLFSERSDKPDTVSDLIAYADWTWEQILALGPYYISAIASYFFGREEKGGVRETLKSECDAPYRHFIEHVARIGDLKQSTKTTFLVDCITSQIFASMHAWSIGGIDAPTLRLRLHLAVFSNLPRVIEGATGKEITRHYDTILP
jgi:AcrR family transcriptional regulator